MRLFVIFYYKREFIIKARVTTESVKVMKKLGLLNADKS